MNSHIYHREEELQGAEFIRALTLLCYSFGIILVNYIPVELDEQLIKGGR